MQRLSLNGSWTLTSDKLKDPIPATVPGCVHTDLHASGILDDPFYRDKEKDQMWIGESDWMYSRTFIVSDDLLAHDAVRLRCHGLDTIATITINGENVAQTDNMYRTYTFDVRNQLKAGENTIAITFESPMDYVRRMNAEHGEPYAWSVGDHRLTGGGWIRKQPSNFGWDWGPQMVTSGIWRDIEIVAIDHARINEVLIRQKHASNRVTLDICATLETLNDVSVSLTCDVTVMVDDATVDSITDQPVSSTILKAKVTIDNPRLWWPNGMGDQPLYTVTVTLKHNGTEIDTWRRQVGLRELRLVRERDEWGQSFRFVANGVPFFAKGANWIPASVYVWDSDPELYERLIKAAADANMNMLRVWGGGIYEHDIFYDLCDRYGITVWQDFMFACGTYPATDEAFMANVRAEAVDSVQRIRHHACLALWCGNNEIEQGLAGVDHPERQMSWVDYALLFDDLLGDVVTTHDPERDYWPGSPHTPVGDRNHWLSEESGDTHLWGVWHGKEPFEWYQRRQDRFVSEFGFQSFPEPSVVAEFTVPEDRNITSYVMEYHQRSGIGNSTVVHYILDWFRLPTSFEGMLWLSQILQAMAMKVAVEGWRRNMPRQMGALYWQLNDLWPAPSWSSIDWRGNWKALHYFARRFFAPRLISAITDSDKASLNLHVTCDSGQGGDATVRWAITTVDGDNVTDGSQAVQLPENGSQHIATVDCRDALDQHGPHNLIAWTWLDVDGAIVSENLATFCRPKHLSLARPSIELQTTQLADESYNITLSSDVPAIYTRLDLPGATFSDNFFHLSPNTPKTIRVHGGDIGTLAIRSLFDTYQ